MCPIPWRSVKLMMAFGMFVLWAAESARGQQRPGRDNPQPSDRVTSARPDTLELLPDIAYREGNPKWRLDLAMPKERNDQPRPAIVFIHGGGWRGGDKATLRKLMLPYAAKGYVCISVNYRLVDDAPFPACVEDVKCAVRWLRANATKHGVDPKRIGGYGSSAGAHLVAMLGLVGRDAGLEGDGPFQEQSSLVQAVCCTATPTDFTDWGGSGFRGESVFLAGPAESLSERKKKASPISYARSDAPPFLVIHGTADKTVPVSQAERFVEALNKAGAKDVTFKNYEGAGHGVFGQHAEETYPMMEAFFARTLMPQASASRPNGRGFVCVEQREGVWWLISPQGEPFVSIGLNHVAAEMLLTPGNQDATLTRYGADFASGAGRFNTSGEAAKRWMQEVFQDMHDWGFNSLGMHVGGSIDPALYRAHVHSLSSVRVARIEGVMRGNAAAELPDVFSEAFAARVEARAKAVCSECAENPLVLGYCYCDLPPWVDAPMLGLKRAGGYCGPWGETLRSQAAQTAGKQAWIGLLKTQYRSPAEVAAAYGLTSSSWDDLAQATDWSHPRDRTAAARDGDAFTAMIADRWYQLLHDAIRRHDPNHLIFGDKLKYDRIPPLLFPVLKKYVDVILIQDEKEPVQDQIQRFRRIYTATGKPILSGDSGFSVRDPRRKQQKGFPVDSYREAGEHYAVYLEGMMRLPFVVGWHYCGYIEGCLGSWLEAQQGFKDAFGKPYPELTDRVREANSQAAKWHRASTP